VGKLIGVIATVLVGVAAATGVTFAVSNASSPDKSVNLENPASPNNMSSSGSGTVQYGSTP
jgi:hypothetical protein